MILEAKNVSFSYRRRGKPVLQNVSLTVESGEITGLFAPSGYGKTTLCRLLAGYEKPDSGQILLDGRDIFTIPPKEFARMAAVLPQSREVPAIPARSLVMHGRFPYLGFPRRPTPADHAAVERAMHDAGAWEYRDSYLTQLSGGERQKVYLAMVLAQDTGVVFMDEPATYLDISHQFEILRLMRTLRGAGKTVVTVLHDLGQALSVSDRILLLDGGRAVFFGAPDALFQSGKLDEVFGIRSQKITIDGAEEYIFRPAHPGDPNGKGDPS